jgi:hypothetical protein
VRQSLLDSAVLLDLLVDPVQVAWDASVHTWQTGASATNAKANHTFQGVSAGSLHDEWTTGVSLAGVLASLGETSANHGLWNDLNASARVLRDTLLWVDDWHTNLVQELGDIIATLLGQTPSSDGSDSVVWYNFSWLWQANWLNGLRELDWFLEDDDGDIIQLGIPFESRLSFAYGGITHYADAFQRLLLPKRFVTLCQISSSDRTVPLPRPRNACSLILRKPVRSKAPPLGSVSKPNRANSSPLTRRLRRSSTLLR